MNNEQATAAPATLHLPLALLALAFFGMVIFQTFESVRERERIADFRVTQEATMQDGAKLRQQLSTLSARLLQLADGGNANAKAIVEQLRREGVTIKTTP